jgi:hypothetical protein
MLGAPETCEHCGGAMTSDVALLNTGKGCVRFELPPHCPSEACRRAHDEATIADMIARGVIDP